MDQLQIFLHALLGQTGVVHFSAGNLVMILVGAIMIYLAISKHYEPLLLIGIGFSCIVANVPGPPDVPGGTGFQSRRERGVCPIRPPISVAQVSAFTVASAAKNR